ncbi:hypothetical protein GO730_04050 [Spirosoma sp. HMF3257]|uniref:Uncharacterized protein n=1 Tax=Spirosoma telluris TaxID=2183553 RepID=A0A327NEY5_9BACT|nr:hypothetical protein [Spirosoma telluris]RAI73772.1 hypothetical protein HMF3257_03990 [Spirosoma telluris]
MYPPNLTVGQPICNGNTYSVSYSLDGPGSLSVVGGTLNAVNHTIENITIGVNVVVKATSGTCVTEITVISPASCSNVCENPGISLSGPVCSTSAVGTYVVNYTLVSGATIQVSSGTALNGVVSGVASGVPLSVTVSLAGCADKVILVPAGTCAVPCQKPTLTLASPVCNGSTYSVSFYSSVASVTANAGQVVGNSITGIPVGTAVSVTATAGAGCVEVQSVASPASCTVSCTLPDLSVGQPICNGNTYSVSYSLNGPGSVSVVGERSWVTR